MPLTWVRFYSQGNSWATGHAKITSVDAGHTIVRTRFGWGFSGYTSHDRNLKNTFDSLMAFGLVTTVGDGTETPPSPAPPASNANPPTERFIWWETRAPVLTTDGGLAERFGFKDSGPQSEDDAEGMVAAVNIPGGQFLNLWATWDPQSSWDPNGVAFLWFYASVGIK